jgi:hypothetical protein
MSPWGWTWVDNAPWGFAPFHYGRWVGAGALGLDPGGGWVIHGGLRAGTGDLPGVGAVVASVSVALAERRVGWFHWGRASRSVRGIAPDDRHFRQVNVAK